MIVPTNHSKSKKKVKKLYLIVGIILIFTSLILYSLKLTFQVFDRHFGYGFICFLIAIAFIFYSYDDQQPTSGNAMDEDYIIRTKENTDDKQL